MSMHSMRSNNNGKPATPKNKSSHSPTDLAKSSIARPNSANLITKCLYRMIGDSHKCHGNVAKKLESLEKDQDQWRERAAQWEKEKKSYKSALENAASFRHPSSDATFYKEYLTSWSESRKLHKITELTEKASFENLPSLIDWINKQPDECTVGQLKEALNNRNSISNELDNSSIQVQSIEKSPDNYLKELIEKNEELSTSLMQFEEELKNKAAGLDGLKASIVKLKKELAEKEAALVEEKTLNEALVGKINELSATGEMRGTRRVVQLQNEIENKELEVVVLKTRNAQLENSLDQYRESNEVYLKTIEELKEKLHLMRLDRCEGGEKEEDWFGSEELISIEDLGSDAELEKASVGIQTENVEEKMIGNERGKLDLRHLTCMATAVEEVLLLLYK
jgi:hypothetical protein